LPPSKDLDVTATLESTAAMTAQIVNPLIKSTLDTFDMMMGVTVRRKGLAAGYVADPTEAISAIISLTGDASGLICLHIPTSTALCAVKKLIDADETGVTKVVADCVGELVNMIAGATKEKLRFNLKLGLPSIVVGESHRVLFPPESQPMSLGFESDLGPFTLVFGFICKPAGA
jgi:chemotaxis protein CheX